MLHKQLEEVRLAAAEQAAALEQKDTVIVILQEQLVKMAEDSLQGADLTALRASLAQSMAAASAAVGSRPATRGASAATSARPPAGSRPPTSGKPLVDEGGVGGDEHMALSSAPYPWTALVDEEGNTYYVNSETGESTWELPPEALISLDGEGGGGGETAHALGEHSISSNVTHGDWVECYDAETGNLFYSNAVTGESAWELPAEVLAATTASEG